MTYDLIPIIVDIVAVFILIFSALRGKKRGIIKTLAGIIVVFLAFSFAGHVANITTPYLAEKYVSPRITATILPESETVVEAKDTNPGEIADIFLKLGIPEDFVTDALDDFSDSLSRDVKAMTTKLSQSIAYKITYAVSFVVYFIILLLLLSLIFKLVNVIARIPGINFVNKTLGFLFGLIFGYLLIIALSYIMLKLKIFITDDIIAKTYVLSFITNFNPLAFIVGA